MSSLSEPERKSSETPFERKARAMRRRMHRVKDFDSRVDRLLHPVYPRTPRAVRDSLYAIASDSGIGLAALTTPGKSSAAVTKARRHAVRELHRAGYSFPQIARWLRLNHTSVLYLFHTASERERNTISTNAVLRGERQTQETQSEISIPDLSGEWNI